MTAGLTETEEYWQQASDGSILVGGCRAARADRDEDVLSRWPTDDVQQALERVLPALFPALAPLQVTHRWAGPMAFTRDRLPLIGPLADVPACWVAGGFCGHGMALAFQLSRLVATALLGGRHDPRLSRFLLDRPVGATA
jgi:glycine/D-amino acid oxidase-like deaminating enzyme